MITTVTGNLPAENFQYILSHEHLLFDCRMLVAPLEDADFYKELSLSNFGKVSRNPYAVLENAAQTDLAVAVQELEAYKKAGGTLVVDATTADFGRDPLKLVEISKKSGIPIVAGCGSYVDGAIEPEIKALSISELRDQILHDLYDGIDGTDVRAGLIGEIGVSDHMTEFESKSVMAAAAAQRESGCGMHIHTGLWTREGLNALRLALDSGADVHKVCINHTDVRLDELYILEILEQGAYIEFDNFGKEFYVDRRNRNLLCGSFATDVERIKFIKGLIQKGFLEQILISNDICLKSMLHRFGGWGYDHVLTNVIPMMEDFGISQAEIDVMMTENPLRFLERP